MHYSSQLCYQDSKNGRIYSTSQEVLELLWHSWLEVNCQAVIRNHRRTKQTDNNKVGGLPSKHSGKINPNQPVGEDPGVMDKHSGLAALQVLLTQKLRLVQVNQSLLSEIVTSFHQTVFDAWTGSKPMQSYIHEADQDCSLASYFKAPFKKLMPMFSMSESVPAESDRMKQIQLVASLPSLKMLELGQPPGSGTASCSVVNLLNQSTINAFFGLVEKKLEQAPMKWDCIDSAFVYIIEV